MYAYSWSSKIRNLTCSQQWVCVSIGSSKSILALQNAPEYIPDQVRCNQMHYHCHIHKMLKLGLVRIPFFELRSFGSNQLRGSGLNIFFSLIKAGICVCLSVCLHFYYVENRSSNRLHGWLVCCCGPKGVQCHILVQYGHVTRSELINF